MTDHQTIHALIDEDREIELSKFTKYDWRKINDCSNNNYADDI